MIEIIYFENELTRTNDISKINKRPVWIDITKITEKEAELIQNEFNLHPLTTEDLLNRHARIKIEQFNDYLFCVFYAIQNNKEKIELVEMDFIIGTNFIISNHQIPLDTFESLKKDNDRLVSLFKKGADFVFHRLLDKEIDNYFPVLEKLDDTIEDIEELVIKDPHPEQLSEILKLKRTLINIKKIGFQQREKISFLAKTEYPHISKKIVPYFRDVYDHAIRVSDTLDNYRDAVSETFDAYMSAVSNNMNEVMKILSVIATIAMPLTVISSIYGTNFTNLPGSKAYFGFWVMILAMVIMSIVMMLLFRKRKWF